MGSHIDPDDEVAAQLRAVARWHDDHDRAEIVAANHWLFGSESVLDSRIPAEAFLDGSIRYAWKLACSLDRSGRQLERSELEDMLGPAVMERLGSLPGGLGVEEAQALLIDYGRHIEATEEARGALVELHGATDPRTVAPRFRRIADLLEGRIEVRT